MSRLVSVCWILVTTFVLFDVISLVAYKMDLSGEFVTGVVGESMATVQMNLLGYVSFVLPSTIVVFYLLGLRSSVFSPLTPTVFYLLVASLVCLFPSLLLFSFLVGELFDLSYAPGELALFMNELLLPTWGSVGVWFIAFCLLILSTVGLASVFSHTVTEKSHSSSKGAKSRTLKFDNAQNDKSDHNVKRAKYEVVSNEYCPPPLSIYEASNGRGRALTTKQRAGLVSSFESSLADYKIDAKVTGVVSGPVVLSLMVDLSAGVKVSSLKSVIKDVARAIKVSSIRLTEVVEGTSSVAVEIPNQDREMVRLRTVLEADEFLSSSYNLPVGLGVGVDGTPMVFDLSASPHLLIGGTTGSGKSVGINALISSLLFAKSPSELRFIMIDPKLLELSVYQGIPHLYTDVITDMTEANKALLWCVSEMESRYELLSKYGVRSIDAFNQLYLKSKSEGVDVFNVKGELIKGILPYIVVVVDEYADLVMVVGKKIEESICRIAQKSRAAGIHLVLGTQRPSVDVVTGLIKSNIPSRIAFKVNSKIDSRTILDSTGAEELLGRGDMLVSLSGSQEQKRAHCAFVEDREVKRLVSHLKGYGVTDYIKLIPSEVNHGVGSISDEDREIYERAKSLLVDGESMSISKLQRHLKIGYNRSARLVEYMEVEGVLVRDEKGNRIASLNSA